MMNETKNTISLCQVTLKRAFDIFFSLLGLLLLWWLILIAALVARFDTGASSGFFLQKRIGRNGKIFSIIKIRTMCHVDGVTTSVTTSNDERITKIGAWFRKTKIDELPQLLNVLLGDMSFVGPRPDVPGFADQLSESDRIILLVRPGITGPATLRYRNEEEMLSGMADPEKYNKDVIYPDKLQINKEYVLNYSFMKDMQYIVRSILR